MLSFEKDRITLVIFFALFFRGITQYPPWRIRLEANIKATKGEVSRLLALDMGTTKKVPRDYSKLSITVALETVKQKLTVLATSVKKHTGEQREFSPLNHQKFTLSGKG